MKEENLSDELPGIGKIHAAVAAIMAEVGGVGKTRKNEQQGYKFRGIADVTLACQPLMAKHQVHVVPFAVLEEVAAERQTQSGKAQIYIRQRIQFRFYHADGSYFPCVTTGEAMDTGDKCAGKVMSYALKYALTQVFCIPEEDPDADTESASPELGAKKEQPVQVPPAQSLKDAAPYPPKNGLTNSEIIDLHTLAKRAGYLTTGQLRPVLMEIAGVPDLKLMERRWLPDITTTLERKASAAVAQDVDEVLGAPTGA